ncbi:MAG: type II toxin-antitoxin system VapC family toxin [Hyphomicrobiales bacterium]
MADIVLDASAILALLRNEPGSEAVAAVIAGGLVSTVNLSEVVAKLVERGSSAADAVDIVDGLPFETADFDSNLAFATGLMWMRGKKQGLSLGDRACLALAEHHRLPVVTADRNWRDLDVAIEIRILR